MGIAAALLISSTALADTCCANVPVRLDPPSAMPGDTVRLTGLRCLTSGGKGPLSLNLDAFWLATGYRPAEDPRDVPGNLPSPDLPPLRKWHPFDSAPPFDSTRRGEATVVVPDLPDGWYQLWWRCDNGGGRGSGIHYSTGPRLAIGVAPDTAIEAVGSSGSPGSRGSPVWLLLALGASVFIVMLRWSPARGSKGSSGT